MIPLESPMMTIAETADFLQVSRSTLYRMLKQRKIPALRIFSTWRFDRRELARWMADISTKPTSL